MFASYPLLSAPHPSSWFAWMAEKVVAHNTAICHAQMCYDGPGWDDMITAVPKNDELSLEYLRMLVRGPFRSMSDLIKLDRVEDKYFLHLMSLDKWPANVLMNFCIASRIPIEFEFFLKPWAQRCEVGFDPVLAFLLTYSYGSKHGTKEQFTERTFNVARSGHMWLDPKSNWMSILQGTFHGVSKPFKTHPDTCRPTNCIWGVSGDYHQLMKMTDDEIAAFYKQPVQVIEPPPKPLPKLKKLDPYMINLGFGHMPIPAVNHLGANPAVEIAMQPGGWAIVPNAPQQQPVEHYDAPEDDGPAVPDGPFHWEEPDDLDDF